MPHGFDHTWRQYGHLRDPQVWGERYERNVDGGTEVGWYLVYSNSQYPSQSYWVRDGLFYRVGARVDGLVKEDERFSFVPHGEFRGGLESRVISEETCEDIDPAVRTAICHALKRWRESAGEVARELVAGA
jgi:hypothetical protein